jgi:hypothetical protein
VTIDNIEYFLHSIDIRNIHLYWVFKYSSKEEYDNVSVWDSRYCLKTTFDKYSKIENPFSDIIKSSCHVKDDFFVEFHDNRFEILKEYFPNLSKLELYMLCFNVLIKNDVSILLRLYCDNNGLGFFDYNPKTKEYKKIDNCYELFPKHLYYYMKGNILM